MAQTLRHRADIDKENLQAAKSEVRVKIAYVQQRCLEQFMTCCSFQLTQVNRHPPAPVDRVRDPPAPSNSDRVS